MESFPLFVPDPLYLSIVVLKCNKRKCKTWISAEPELKRYVGFALGIIHLLAIAKTAKIDLKLDDFKNLEDIPILLNMKPHGTNNKLIENSFSIEKNSKFINLFEAYTDSVAIIYNCILNGIILDKSEELVLHQNRVHQHVF